MSDDPGAVDKSGALPGYADKPSDADDAVTLSISTTPGEWLVNTNDAVVVPMSMIEVVEALRSQKLTERSLVWRAGMQEWAPVDNVPQLKLAARLPSVMPPSSAAPRSPRTTNPPPKPARSASSMKQAAVTLPAPATRTPLPPPPRLTPRPSTATLPSRKTTLPLGSPAPVANASQPRQSRPTPRPALPPPSPEDADVLAVYDRPAATISFELLPEPAPPAPRPVGASLPQTLAPTTTDSSPRREPLPLPRAADLSVVAARDFRQAQQFSKRLIVGSSLGSALVASLLTLLLSRGEGPDSTGSAPAPAQTLAAAAPLVEVAAPPPVVAQPEPVAAVEAPSPEPSAAPKPKRKVRWKPAPKAAPAAATTDDVVAAASPSSDANPYDVQLEDSAPAKPPSDSHGSGLEPGSAVATDSPAPSPGF